VEDVCVSMKQSRKKIIEVSKLMGWGEGKDKYNRKVKRNWWLKRCNELSE